MADRRIPDLRTMAFNFTFWKTIDNSEGNKVDMYLLHDEHGDGLVSIAVPAGRDDIVKFIARSCTAGQQAGGVK